MPTGVRINFPSDAVPTNISGVPIDTSMWTGSDGFSPGSQILVHVPGLDPTASKIAPQTDIGSSLLAHAPIVLIDTRTGKLWPYWAEMDANNPDSSTQPLIISPAINLAEGDTYIVALRDLKGGNGSIIRPGGAFESYVKGKVSGAQSLARLAHFKSIFAALGKAHVSASSLYLAWDFTVASSQDLTGRMVHIRDVAFAQLGNHSPHFQVDSVVDYTVAQNLHISRKISGTFDVPSFLDQPGGPPGSEFNLGSNGLPTQIPGNVEVANFTCVIPRSADANPLDPTQVVHPTYLSLYGHGLFGNAAGEVPALGATANLNNISFCGTDWLGMSLADIPTSVAVMKNLSLFPTFPDRLQQGLLDALFLGRLMDRSDGFAMNPAFQSAGSAHSPLIAAGKGLFYYGNSLGGIIGGAFTAVSNDVYRSVLGVPGMNLTYMMERSSDFAPFFTVIEQSYPDKVQEAILYDMIQVLWDRGEADGYAENMTNHPLPGTHAHTVLVLFGFGDHQVPNSATEDEIRTIGAEVHIPALEPGRSPDVQPLWGIPAIRSYPYRGNAAFIWDSGTPAPPPTDTPDSSGIDPHNNVPRRLPAAQQLLGTFLEHGIVTNVCGNSPCLSPPSPRTPE